MTDKTVTVPRELLREVLALAASDNNYIESEMSPVGRRTRENQRARIAELRKPRGWRKNMTDKLFALLGKVLGTFASGFVFGVGIMAAVFFVAALTIGVEALLK